MGDGDVEGVCQEREGCWVDVAGAALHPAATRVTGQVQSCSLLLGDGKVWELFRNISATGVACVVVVVPGAVDLSMASRESCGGCGKP